jgi:hypothetical protein
MRSGRRSFSAVESCSPHDGWAERADKAFILFRIAARATTAPQEADMTETERMLEQSQQRQEATIALLCRRAEMAEAQSNDFRGRLQRAQGQADERARERDAVHRKETVLAAALRRIADFEPDPTNGGDRDQQIAGFAKLTAAYTLGCA